jgi:hypothetical protein
LLRFPFGVESASQTDRDCLDIGLLEVIADCSTRADRQRPGPA